MNTAFPDFDSRGCWFHYSQVSDLHKIIPFQYRLVTYICLYKAIYRRACKEGMMASYINSADVRRVVKMLVAVALLPVNKIHEALFVNI